MEDGTGGWRARTRRGGWRGVAVVFLALAVAAIGAGGCGGRRAEGGAVQREVSLSAGADAVAHDRPAAAQMAERPAAQPAVEAGEQHGSLGASGQSLNGGWGGGSAAVGVSTLLAGRKLVRTADLELEVRDLDAALTRIEAIAAKAGGIVTATNIYSSSESPGKEPRPLADAAGAGGGSAPPGEAVGAGAAGFRERTGPPREASVTVRVPVARFEGALTELRRLGHLVQESVSTQDVTAQYVDLEARVASLEEQERRLRVLVGRSGSLEELLRLEGELARVRGEIESLRGQIRTLGEQADYSTLNVSLKETVLASPGIEAPRGVGERSARAFVRAANAVMQAGAALLVALAALTPVAVAVGGPAAGGWLVYRALRRRSRPA